MPGSWHGTVVDFGSFGPFRSACQPVVAGNPIIDAERWFGFGMCACPAQVTSFPEQGCSTES